MCFILTSVFHALLFGLHSFSICALHSSVLGLPLLEQFHHCFFCYLHFGYIGSPCVLHVLCSPSLAGFLSSLWLVKSKEKKKFKFLFILLCSAGVCFTYDEIHKSIDPLRFSLQRRIRRDFPRIPIQPP